MHGKKYNAIAPLYYNASPNICELRESVNDIHFYSIGTPTLFLVTR